MDLARFYEIVSALWVVWFFLLFGGIVLWVLRPGTRERMRDHADIPFRNDPN